MELKKTGKKLIDIMKKFRYAVLILVIGLAMMVIPTGNSRSGEKQTTSITTTEEDTSLQTQLADILTTVEGAGLVRVLLSTAEGEQIQYQTDFDVTDREGDVAERVTTVTVTDAEKNQSGLIQQVNPPKYRGAVIVCEGADDPTVRLAVSEAVSKATGLGMNQITVLKMK